MSTVNIIVHTLSGSSQQVQITPDAPVVDLWEQLPRPEFHAVRLFHGASELLAGSCAEAGLGEGTLLTVTTSEAPEKAMAVIRQAVASVNHMGLDPKRVRLTERALDFLLEFTGHRALDENCCEYLLAHINRFQFTSQTLLPRCARLLGRALPPTEFGDRLIQLCRDNPVKLHWVVALGEMVSTGKQQPKIDPQFLSQLLSAIDLQFWLRRFPELACEACLGLSRLASRAFCGDDQRGNRAELLKRFEAFELKVEALSFELQEKAAVGESLKILKALDDPSPRTGDGSEESAAKAAAKNMVARPGSSSSVLIHEGSLTQARFE